jgi:hypothetical protein
MKLPSGEFVWGLGDNSKTNNTVREFKGFARRMYRSYMGDLADTNLFDEQLQTEIGIMQDKLVASGRLVPGKFTRGVLDLETEYASGFKPRPAPEPVCVAFSINGAGSTWNMGYPFDIGETLDKSKVWHQPIGYNTAPIPMNKGVQDGQAEFIRQLDMPRGSRGLNCTVLPWTGIFYSMGALVGCGVLDRILHGDLSRFKRTYLGSATFGNPRRQMDHTFPGCTWSSGEGIATPTDHDMPVEHWDMACDKHMPGGGGDDLYTKMSDDENDEVQRNMRAVWDIVNKGNPMSLAGAVFKLLSHPNFTGGYDAAVAAFKALNFFVAKGTGPHVKYQFTQPIENDPRDCWELVREHIADLVARRQPIYPNG